MKKRILSVLMALVMVMSLLPVAAMAAEEEGMIAADNQASSIAISGITMTPDFAADIYSYTLPDQAYNKSSVSFTVKAADGAAITAKLNDKAVSGTFTSGKAKTISALTAGQNKIEITVAPPAESSLESSTYTFLVKRTPAMTKLTLSDGDGNPIPMNQAFAVGTIEGYAAIMPVGAALKLTPTFSHAASTGLLVKAGDGEYAELSGDGYAIVEGENIFKLKAVSTDGIMEGAEYTLTVTGVATATHSVAIPFGAGLSVTDPNGNPVVLPEGADIEGTTYYAITGLMSGENYAWRVGKYGYNAQGGTFVAGAEALVVELTEADTPSSELTAEWESFRNSDANMAVITADVPTSASETALKWVTESSLTQGSGLNMNNPSPMLIVDGKIITTTGSEIIQLSMEDGSILNRGDMVIHNGALGNAAPVYGGGMVFMPLSDGRVQAFDAVTLESLWVSESLGSQCTTSLVYDEGYIYGSTGNSAPGKIFCIQTADEDPAATNETKYATWMIHDKDADKGSYWSAPYVSDQAVVYGTDSGYLYSRDKKTGEVISKLSLDNGGKNQRSGIAYYNGRIYGGDANKNLFSAAIAEDGSLSDLKMVNYSGYAFSITSTPVICDDVVFFGGSKQLMAADANTLELIATTGSELFVNSGAIQASSMLKKGEDGKTYLYFTQNAKPGALYVAVYDGEAKTLTATALYTPETDKQQYSIISPICDEEGTIYYRNDSGYIFAVSKWEGSNCPVAFTTDPADASIVVKDESGAEQIAVSAGTYDLPAGTYSYTVSRSGYTSQTDSFTVSEEEAAGKTVKNIAVSLEKQSSGSSGSSTITVFVSVEDPEGETYLSKTRYTVEPGTTVYELLEETGLDIMSTESDLGIYVEAIEGLAEFDEGAGSGWMYRIGNGFPQTSCGTHVLKNGDYVEWLYTRDFGADIGDTGAVGGGISDSEKEPEDSAGEIAQPAFIDVSGHWGEDAINYVVEKGLMNGVSDTEFAPESLLNRAMLATILYRLAGSPAVTGENTFDDVAEGKWYSDAITWAAANGIVTGYDADSFGPMDNITREQMAAMLWRFAKYMKVDVSAGEDTNILSYDDAQSISEYAIPAIQWACGEGLINGRTESTIAPKGNAKRVEIATVLQRYLEKTAK